MRKLVECVPNFSEGRRPEVVDAIAQAILSVPGVALLDRHVDPSHNRSVLTLVGPPGAVRDAVFRAIEKAAERIDLSAHRGVHPRIGATDVVPFVPLRSVTMADCVRLAEDLGREVAERLSIPVYLYEEAARRPERRLLSSIRRGQFEGLAAEIRTNPDRAPDFGPPRLHPTAGAVAIGARPFLVAFNVNLETDRVSIARSIAKALRERDGGFPGVRALGLGLEGEGRVQVSMNLTDIHKTSLMDVHRRIVDLAREAGVRVRDSELVGLAPEIAIHAAARDALGAIKLDREKVLEARVQDALGPPLDLHAFLDDMASTAPSPGGGSAAALAAALAAASAEKVANLTRAKDRYRLFHPELDALARELHAARSDLVRLAERDAAAFDALMAAFRRPKGTPEETSARAAAIETAALEACRCPLAISEAAAMVVRAAETLGEKGTPNGIADAIAAAAMARGALESAHAMFQVNLPGVKDPATAEALRARFDALQREVDEDFRGLEETFESRRG